MEKKHVRAGYRAGRGRGGPSAEEPERVAHDHGLVRWCHRGWAARRWMAVSPPPATRDGKLCSEAIFIFQPCSVECVGGVAVMSSGSSGRQSVFRRKPVEAFATETRPDTEGGKLSRSIGLFQLTMFGVGATIGTGIFIVLTEAGPEAGQGVVVSFGLAWIPA